jgi:opacity protein-like surface antigen
MTIRTAGWLAALALGGTLFSLNTLADDALFGLSNPLGLYIGAGVGQSNIGYTQFDDSGDSFRRNGSEPLGWNAMIGLRPIPFLGAEAEYLDFGNTDLGGRSIYSTSSESQGVLFGENHDRAAAVFAVGYLPLPIPWIEPFAKLGWGEIWDHQHFDAAIVNGAATFLPFTQSTHSNGVAYGAGVQFHFGQLAARAQYEVISSSRSFGERDDPGLLSVGLNWTF